MIRSTHFKTGEKGYELETINFMTANGINDDTTLYNASTAYEKTGSELWNIIDQVIKFYKTEGVWDDIFLFYPIIGENSNHFSYNLIDPSLHQITWFGSWVFNGQGCIGNGVNTYGNTNFVAQGLNTGDIDMSLTTCESTEALKSASVHMSANGGGLIYFEKNYESNGTTRGGIGAATDVSTIPSSIGVQSVSRGATAGGSYKQEIIINGEVTKTGSGAGTGLPSNPLYFGAYNLNNSPINVAETTLSSTILSLGGFVRTLIIQRGLDMLERSLNRATWSTF